MLCLYCHKEYYLTDMVLVTPAICPFCILGHGNYYNVDRILRTRSFIKKAVEIIKSPHMVHLLKCIVPTR